MELKRSKTAEALQSAFAAESQAYTRYMLFAAAARKAELEQIADIFSQVAKNEAEHAEHEFNFLGGFVDTKKNLEAAARREHYEWTEMYPELQKQPGRRALPKLPTSSRG
jgi:Rubrerythrin